MEFSRVTFKNRDEREEALMEMARMDVISKDCATTLIADGFLSAPASTKYHGSYKGGLFDHSYNVAMALKSLTQNLNLQWEDKNSPFRVGLLHDLCKIDQYIWDAAEGRYIYFPSVLLTEHGIKSVVLAQQLPDIHLNEEEIACITYHMGAFTDSSLWKNYTNAIHKYPNVLWTHTADCYAAHVMEVE